MIGSFARNCGKTTLACEIIKRFSKITPIIGIKVSTKKAADFRYKGEDRCHPEKGFEIVEEHNPNGNKDTSRMLAAGASRVYRLEVSQNNLRQAAEALLKIIGRSAVCVCESNSLRRIIEPGLFLMLRRKKSRYYKPSADAVKKLADKIILFDGKNFNFNLNNINLLARKWSLTKFLKT